MGAEYSAGPTPPQLTEAEKNAKVQHDSWVNVEKLNCRKIAMDYALQIKLKDGGDLNKDAQAIYDWLTKDLK